MQNMNEMKLPDISNSNAKIPNAAKYPSHIHHPSNKFLSNSIKHLPQKNSLPSMLSKERNFNIIPIKKQQEEDINHTLLKCDKYRICLVTSNKQRIKTTSLIKHMYASRGYCTETTTDLLDPNQISLEASVDEQVVGTLTIINDTETGLPADVSYKNELKAIRKKNRKVCELSKFATNPQHSSKELLASLFNLAYIYARTAHNATDFIIEVNPRHAGYYKRLLGFNQIGEVRTCERVNAPAVLLHLELEYVDTQLTRLARLREYKQKTIYTYFLTKHAERNLAKRIYQNLIKFKLQSTYTQEPILCSRKISG